MSRADTRHLITAGFHAMAAVDALASAAGDDFALDTAVLDPVVAREPQVILQSALRSMVIFGRTVKLSRRRFDVAEVLAGAASRGAIASRRDIERKLYGNQVVDDKLVADAVRDLRDAIARVLPAGMSPADFIQTRTGQGYALGVERDLVRLDP
jgi:DNA-binding response OmpR family regulator